MIPEPLGPPRPVAGHLYFLLKGRTLPPSKTLYPLFRRLSGPQGRSGQVRKISPPPGFDPRTVAIQTTVPGPRVVCYIIIICFSFSFSNYTTYVFLIFFLCLFFVLYFCFLFCVFCVFVLFCVLFLLLCCRFPIFVPAYRLMPPGGSPVAVNK